MNTKGHEFESGTFLVGCNYWASHAGTNMWHDWDEKQIDRDFSLLEKHGIRYLRVFPLWPDFQPLRMHYMVEGQEKELRLGENPLPHTEAGRAGMDEVMVGRFRTFCDLAERHGLSLVVGLVTGWMSGRWYVPEPFRTVNVLTDARAIQWEVRFVRYMVRTFRDHPSICAWDLGNECNCLGKLERPEEGYVWVNAITSAIKTEDRTRPVLSGMHGSFPESAFRPEDLGELLDVLCTHPYPLFTPYCDTDPLTENKSALHAVAETVLYRGLSGKPAFAEEVGTLGPMIASEENAAAYVNTVLHLLLAHDCLGFMWWCGFEQSKLTHTPYDWNAVERELGLFRIDMSPKPVLRTLSDFVRYTDTAAPLPPRTVDAVCVLSADTDTWRAAFGTFILSKQAGLDIEFCRIGDEIPPARAYMLPSVGHDHLAAHEMKVILDRVKAGAVLYVSVGAALLSPFRDIFGLQPTLRYRQTTPDRVTLGGHTFTLSDTFKIDYADGDAEVMARDENGHAVMAKHAYGNGTVYFLAYPIEDMAATVPGIDGGKDEVPLHLFYRAMDKLKNPDRIVCCDNPHIMYTEHVGADGCTVVAVNASPRPTDARFTLRDGYALDDILKSQSVSLTETADALCAAFPPNAAVIFRIRR